MLMVSTYLAPSAIEGLGVFAGERIERGRLMWSLNPKFDIFIHASEIEAYPTHMQDFIARYTYPHLEMPGVVVLDSDNGKFMNHSLKPNTDFRIFDKGYALVDIAQGEEITCNYYEFDPSFAGFFVIPQAVANKRPRVNGRPQKR
jgi:SET domain-containing protein